MNLKNYRLPKSLRPYFYDLTVKTSFDVLTEPNSFDGDLLIRVSCLERTNLISMHQTELDISQSSIKVTNDANNAMPLACHKYTAPLSLRRFGNQKSNL